MHNFVLENNGSQKKKLQLNDHFNVLFSTNTNYYITVYNDFKFKLITIDS